MNSLEIFNRRIQQAVKASTILVRDSAQEQHRYATKTGNLEKATDYRITDSGMQGVVFLDSNVAKYAPFVHEGTAAHLIRPKNKTILRFVPRGGNGFIFARKVFHPGTKADPFLYDALRRNIENITDIFARYTDSALEDVTQGLVKKEYTIKVNM
jgi:hypothetical protein